VTAPAWTLIEKPSRVYAVDANGNEICGARQPYGTDNNWVIYVHTRVAPDMPHVTAGSRKSAVGFVTMVASLFVAAQQGVAA